MCASRGENVNIVKPDWGIYVRRKAICMEEEEEEEERRYCSTGVLLVKGGEGGILQYLRILRGKLSTLSRINEIGESQEMEREKSSPLSSLLLKLINCLLLRCENKHRRLFLLSSGLQTFLSTSKSETSYPAAAFYFFKLFSPSSGLFFGKIGEAVKPVPAF